MNATELRIGNFFYQINRDTPEDTPNTPIPVPLKIGYFGLFDHVISCKINDNIEQVQNSIIVQFRDMVGIELTEEWLLKFGFDFTGDYFISSRPKMYKRFGIRLRLMANEFIFWHENNFTKIEYVHQLQNLYFALTGQELVPFDGENFREIEEDFL